MVSRARRGWLRDRLALPALVGASLLAGCGDADPDAEIGPPTRPLQALSVDTLAVLGAPQGEPAEAFGGIWDVAVAPDGRFAVLDFENRAVHLYDPSARSIGAITAVGTGPGELQRPSGIGWTSAGELQLWDPSNARVSRFRIGPADPELIDARGASAFGETGFCSLGDQVYLSFLEGGQVIHEIAPEGGIARSFSPAPGVPGIEAIPDGAREMALEDLSPSLLLCDPDGGGRILEVSFFQPRIQLHDPDGSLLWSRELDDFFPVRPWSPDDMGVGFQYAEGTGSQVARSAVPWADGRVLVQYEVQLPGPRPEGRDFHALESRLIRLDSGEEEDRTRDLPLFLAASGNRLFQVRHHPYPQVVVLERR